MWISISHIFFSSFPCETQMHPFITMYEDLDVDLSSYFTNVGSPLATFDLPCKSKGPVLNFGFNSKSGIAE